MVSKEYDYIIVGSSLFGSVFDHKMYIREKNCLVKEKHNHLGGNTLNKIINHILLIYG